ncbi:MAG: hypothetical protein IJV18_12770 [Acidaminococcaceae bacterium]|nr:hypothetical protein [Acidaminococcaceae bacterium]
MIKISGKVITGKLVVMPIEAMCQAKGILLLVRNSAHRTADAARCLKTPTHSHAARQQLGLHAANMIRYRNRKTVAPRRQLAKGDADIRSTRIQAHRNRAILTQRCRLRGGRTVDRRCDL